MAASPEKRLGVYVGRFSPVHLGHERVIDELVARFGGRCLLVIGSANTQQSIRHFFSYEDRRKFLSALYPDLRMTGLGDFGTDREWLMALDDQINLLKEPDEKVTFLGGCQEDVEFFGADGRDVELLNRFDGSGPKVSATEVRDALIRDRDVSGLLNPKVMDLVKETFRRNWSAFSRK